MNEWVLYDSNDCTYIPVVKEKDLLPSYYAELCPWPVLNRGKFRTAWQDQEGWNICLSSVRYLLYELTIQGLHSSER